MTTLDRLISAMIVGMRHTSPVMSNTTAVRELLDSVCDEHYTSHAHQKEKYQIRANMKTA